MNDNQTNESVIERSKRPLVRALALEEATVAIPERPMVEETEWMTFNGYEAKFRRVPAFAYAKARQHLRRVMRDNKPEPPVVSRGTRSMVNKNDPYYLDQMSLWSSEWEDLQRDIITTTSILVGIVLKDEVPPEHLWVDYVLDILGSLGLTEDDLFVSFKYNDQKMRELLFKQYVILANPDDMERFNAFQGGQGLDDDDGDTDGEADFVEAVDMFRSEPE